MQINVTTEGLYPWQEDVFASYVYDDKKTYVLNLARQQGKTYLISQLALYSAINEKHSAIGVTSLTYKQSKLIYNYISEFLKGTPLVEYDNKSSLEIKLINGSKITFLTVQNPDNVRGNTFTHLFCDEFAFYADGIYDKVLQPTTIAKGQKTVLCSTPRGTNKFYDLFMLGLEPDNNIKSFKYTWEANPNFNIQEIETIKLSIPEAIFRQEYLCEFTDNGSVFNNLRDICILNEWPSPMGNLYCGIDIGLFHDYAVATIFDANGNLVDMYRSKTGSINKLNTELEHFLKKHRPVKTLLELNNVGVSAYEYLAPRIKGIEGFKTTGISKGDLINQLQNSIDDRRIKLPSHTFVPEVYTELVNYGFKYSEKTRQIQYEAISGHDDVVMSLALANKIFVESNFSIKPKIKLRFG
jgi:phage FluMu gp28-like protein